ncbi:MAG TPA: AlkA N-terminal domain-containing protein [Acidimicrobiales bacterium]|nr:AlkA N-terminal domain-containing protein [Acidimicrobiales bacterium]
MSESRQRQARQHARLRAVIDEERCYRAVCSRDGRFDGAFFTAVLTTGIYCRPSCPAVTPKRVNVRFYTTAATAQDAGFRACKRCRPDAAPGSPEWLGRQDTVARAVRLIADGVVDREGISGLGKRIGYSTRQLHRIVFAELGTGPLTLARAHRVQHARMLLETTDLQVTEVALAAGFRSVRQFNDCVRLVYGMTPTDLRRAGPPKHRSSTPTAGANRPGGIDVHLSYRPPLDLNGLIGFFAMRAIRGVESFDGSVYRRVLGLPHGSGVLSVRADQQGDLRSRSTNRRVAYLACNIALDDHRDFVAAVARARRLFDLDADPVAVGTLLGADPALGVLVDARPGLRVPGSADGFETALRAVAGQQVSLKAARGLIGRITEMYGKPLGTPAGELTHQFPSAEAIAAAAASSLPLPSTRADALRRLAGAVCDGTVVLDPGADRDESEQILRRLPGIGAWTAGYIRMRGLGDPDVFLGSDLAVRRQLSGLQGPASPDGWRPWRSYATAHLWNGASNGASAATPAAPASAPDVRSPRGRQQSRQEKGTTTR